jgi:hypothetical protein
MSKIVYFATPILFCIYIFSTGHRILNYDPGFKVDNFTSASITSFTVEDNDEFNTLTNILPNESSWVELVTTPSGYITFTIQFPATRPSGRIRIKHGNSIIYCANIPAGNNIVGYVLEWTDFSPSIIGYRIEYESISC